ncbi:MAG: hypothetical protein FJ361_06015 [Gemmatimonadetes bacterium]|nr:hypothetical protein [Gemmatimonadota bacterium]
MHQKIKTLVEQSGLKYSITEDGGLIKVVFSFADGRTQLVFIDADPDTFEGTDYIDFDISSPICFETELDAGKALKLLQGMAGRKAGAVRIQRGMVTVSYDLNPNGVSPRLFFALVNLVAKEADELEKIVEPNGQKDRF